MKKRKITSYNMHKLTKKLVNKIIKTHKIDYIVGISRGGLIPARYIAKLLNIRRIYSIGIERYGEDTCGSDIPVVYQHLNQKFDPNKTILIVDDIIDSGKSMELSVKEVKNSGGINIITCSLHYKLNSQYTPTFYGERLKNDTWLVYDWEID